MDTKARKDSLKKALMSGDARKVAAALALPSLSLSKLPRVPQLQQHQGGTKLKDAYGGDWGSIVGHWLNACEASEAGYAVKCYECMSSFHESFHHKVFVPSQGNWLVPALHQIARNTYKAALLADLEAGNKDNAKLQNAVSLLQESYSRTINDRKPLLPNQAYDQDGSKQSGTLAIVNLLFSMYFRLNTLRLCRNLQKPVETKKLHTQAAMGHIVTYHYYVGRLSLFEDQYDVAEEKLSYALANCHRSALQNKKRILRYLVPVKLYRGRMPAKDFLSKYELFEFVLLVDAIKKGDMKTFNETLIQFQDRFIRQGTYLLLEKCKTVCYRQLFRRVYKIIDNHQIPLSKVANALKYLGMSTDLDEVECILANLIYRGYIRGYLSHMKRILVLSRRDPFPIAAVISK